MTFNLKTWKLENIKNYPWDMLNNFCFHVYAQKKNLQTWKLENIKNYPWDMLSNFGFHVYV